MTSSSENGEGIIDGVIEDYELSSITSTDFKYSQFSGRMSCNALVFYVSSDFAASSS